MKIFDFFKQKAEKAEQNLGNLAAQQYNNHQKNQALGKIQERFIEMSADGYLDESEVKELTQQLRDQGLDTAAIENLFAQLKGTDSSVRVDGSSKLSELIESKLDNARDAVGDSQADLQFQIQMAVSEYTDGMQSASELSKAQFKADMVAIGNIRG